MSRYAFLPWLKLGLGSLVARRDEDPAAALPDRVVLPVALSLNGSALAAVDVRLVAASEVTGLDRAQVVRREPAPRSTAFEPNYFPFLELSRPDLPWLFTPAIGDAAGRLRPWLVLTVVRAQAGVEIAEGTAGTSTLRIGPPARPGDELPDLAESWAWAHVQVTGSVASDQELATLLRSRTGAVVSRLLAPRRLNELTRYHACLVPAFENARLAGLGREVSGPERNSARPAWASGPTAPASVELPLYDHWEFTSGPATDFEQLAERLDPAPPTPRLGLREVDVGHAGSGIPEQANAVVDFTGVLRGKDAAADSAPGDIEDAIVALVNTAAVDGDEDPVVAPPIYGGLAARRDRVGAAGAHPRWLNELNRSPCLRFAAALGAQVVRGQQERFMAAAWDQAGQVRDVAAALRRGQLAREAGRSLKMRNLDRLDSAARLQITAAAHRRLMFGDATVQAVVRTSPVPPGGMEPSFRRLARPGTQAARLANVITERAGELVKFTTTLPLHRDPPWEAPGIDIIQHDGAWAVADGSGPPGSPEWPPRKHGDKQWPASGRGAYERPTESRTHGERPLGERRPGDHRPVERPAESNRIAEPGLTAARRGDATRGEHDDTSRLDPAPSPLSPTTRHTPEETRTPASPTWPLGGRPTRGPTPTPVLSPPGTAPANVAKELVGLLHPALSNLTTLLAGDVLVAEVRKPLAIDAIDKAVVAQLDPGTTVLARLRPRVTAPAEMWRRRDPLDPVVASPDLEFPLAVHLAETAPEWFLPGLDQLPDESAVGLAADAKFIEAFMVGANHEMARELVWREYPADVRATCFRRFWETSGFQPVAAEPDLKAIHDWDSSATAGTNLTGATARALLILAVRGELLRRYPDALVYAVHGAWDGQTRGPEVIDGVERREWPLFGGRLRPDIVYFGFHLDRVDARGSPRAADGRPGWYFAIEQHPTAPRFGLDAPTAYGGAPPTWDEVSWGHLAMSAAELAKVSYASPRGRLAKTTIGDATWGANSAHLARITLQSPVRVLLHADQHLDP
jgi:hypothetical protein